LHLLYIVKRGTTYLFGFGLTSVRRYSEKVLGVAGINRNHRPTSVGIGGRLRPESVAEINRNRRPESSGICK